MRRSTGRDAFHGRNGRPRRHCRRLSWQRISWRSLAQSHVNKSLGASHSTSEVVFARMPIPRIRIWKILNNFNQRNRVSLKRSKRRGTREGAGGTLEFQGIIKRTQKNPIRNTHFTESHENRPHFQTIQGDH